MLDHLALQVSDVDAAAAFCTRVLTAAGVREAMRSHSPGDRVGLCGSVGRPRERPVYHPGYDGVFVRDPDGNDAEAVHHGFPARA